MSLTSFLTQDPMQYSQGMSQSSTALPSWYNDYTQGILQNAAQFANLGYQPYGGPRVAGPTSDQTASYGTVAGQQGVGSGIAQQGVNTVNSTLAQPNASQAAAPYLSAASGGINSALAMPNASQAASPYLTAASTPLSTQMQSFMNPYLNDVVNNSNMLASRNFTENVLPALQDQFTQAGQVYGGSRQGEYAERMARDLNLNTQMADQNSLAQGFNTALGGATSQAGINAGLGATAGNLANAAQSTGLSGAGLNANIGATAGGLQNASQNTGITGASTLGGLGTIEQNNALNQALIQNQMGQQQQQNTQANYNTAYQDFLNQTQWPLTAASAMQGALSGIQVPSGSTNYNYAPYGWGMSPLAQAGSIYGGINSMFGQGGSLTNSPSSSQSNNGLSNTALIGLLNRMYGNSTGAARGGSIRLARGGNVRPTLTLPRRTISPLAQYARAA